MNFCALPFLILAATAAAQSDGTALGALKLLPKDAAKRLARIEARDGAPVPERWYFLVHDPDSPRGVREFVAAGGKIVASRTLSQFADYVNPADVIGTDSVKFNSDQVARLAALFATANGGQIGTLNYELTKIPAQAAPVWRATVLDPQGDQLGVIVVTAAKGALVSQDGFEKTPVSELLSVATPAGQTPAPVRAVKTSAEKGNRTRPEEARTPTPAPAQTPTPTPKSGILNRIFGPPKPLKIGR